MENKKTLLKRVLLGSFAVLLVLCAYLLFVPQGKKPESKWIKSTDTSVNGTRVTCRPIPKAAIREQKRPSGLSRPVGGKIPTYPSSIKGSVVTLKKLTVESAFDYFSVFSANVRKHLEFPTKVTYGYIERHVRNDAEKMEKGLTIAYNIWDNTDNKMVGSIQIREKSDHDPGQLSMWINENYRGGGRIQQALFLISQAYFTARPAATGYIAHVRPRNVASQRAMKKFGFVKVGDYIKEGKVTRYIFELRREAQPRTETQPHTKVIARKSAL